MKKMMTNMRKLEFVIHFHSNINSIHTFMKKMVIFLSQGSLGVSYLAFSTIKELNKSFLMKNLNFYCLI